MTSVGTALGELLAGACCPGCGEAAWRLCAACRRDLSAAQPSPVAGHGAIPVWAATVYGGVTQACLVAYKERHARHLAPDLGHLLARAIAGLVSSGPGVAPALVLTPLPSEPARVRERGDDVVVRLAREAAGELRKLGVPTRVDACLRQVRRVADQAGLGVDARAANLTGSLRARPRGAGVRIVVDDITTTGASLREAARALVAADLTVAGAAVVAATPRHDLNGTPSLAGTVSS